jgi:cytidylate kinase
VSSPSYLVIAVDGPGAAGKSSVAQAVARELGLAYVDTGAMYRTLAWHCLRSGVNLAAPRSVAAACRRWNARLRRVEGDPPQVALFVDGYRPVEELRREDVTRAASDVAVVPAVRKWMKDAQRECLQFGGVVMEGRDIGSNVFPQTEFKFWLDATAEERARRRRAQGLADNLAYRDRQDSARAAAPLMPGIGARRVDTTGRSLEAVVEEIVAIVRKALAERAPAEAQGGQSGAS